MNFAGSSIAMGMTTILWLAGGLSKNSIPLSTVMKNRRLQFAYRKNASVLHRAVGDCLRDSEIFQSYKIYQEYPVNKINPEFQSGREKFDWVILDIGVVIECHGKQHYEPVTFGGIDVEEATKRFNEQQYRDEAKKTAALEAGFTYIAIPYTDQKKVDDEYILKMVESVRDNQSEDRRVLEQSPRSPTRDWKTDYQQRKQWLEESGIAEEQKRRAKEIRREQYLRTKELKKKLEGGSDE
jgi:hypothetical protein